MIDIVIMILIDSLTTAVIGPRTNGCIIKSDIIFAMIGRVETAIQIIVMPTLLIIVRRPSTTARGGRIILILRFTDGTSKNKLSQILVIVKTHHSILLLSYLAAGMVAEDSSWLAWT